jgi:hypothetical protein
VTFGKFAAFLVGCLDVLQYAFMSFYSIFNAASALRSLFGYNSPVVTPFFMVLIYAILSAALVLMWRKNSFPFVFMGFSVFLALLYLLFVFGTIPQMDSEKWMNNYEEEDAPSFGMQFISGMGRALAFSHGLSAAFLLCDKVSEVSKSHTLA